MGIIENCLERAFGDVEHVDAYNTYQVKNYDRYALAAFPESTMRQQTMMHGMTFKVASSPINPLTEASTYTKAIRKSSNNGTSQRA